MIVGKAPRLQKTRLSGALRGIDRRSRSKATLAYLPRQSIPAALRLGLALQGRFGKTRGHSSPNQLVADAPRALTASHVHAHELACIARIVEKALLTQLPEGLLDQRGVKATPRKSLGKLGGAVIAP